MKPILVGSECTQSCILARYFIIGTMNYKTALYILPRLYEVEGSIIIRRNEPQGTV